LRQLKAEQGKDLVLWGSLSLVQQLMAADLIDDYHLQLCPVFLGGGRRLLPDLPDQLGLRRVSTRSYDTGVVFLHYERRRDG
jgi:dihydrofolate reductase